MLQRLRNLSENNSKNDQQRWELARSLRDQEEMAKSKIDALEHEIRIQNEFFQKTEKNYDN